MAASIATDMVEAIIAARVLCITCNTNLNAIGPYIYTCCSVRPSEQVLASQTEYLMEFTSRTIRT